MAAVATRGIEGALLRRRVTSEGRTIVVIHGYHAADCAWLHRFVASRIGTDPDAAVLVSDRLASCAAGPAAAPGVALLRLSGIPIAETTTIPPAAATGAAAPAAAPAAASAGDDDTVDAALAPVDVLGAVSSCVAECVGRRAAAATRAAGAAGGGGSGAATSSTAVSASPAVIAALLSTGAAPTGLGSVSSDGGLQVATRPAHQVLPRPAIILDCIATLLLAHPLVAVLDGIRCMPARAAAGGASVGGDHHHDTTSSPLVIVADAGVIGVSALLALQDMASIVIRVDDPPVPAGGGGGGGGGAAGSSGAPSPQAGSASSTGVAGGGSGTSGGAFFTGRFAVTEFSKAGRDRSYWQHYTLHAMGGVTPGATEDAPLGAAVMPVPVSRQLVNLSAGLLPVAQPAAGGSTGGRAAKATGRGAETGGSSGGGVRHVPPAAAPAVGAPVGGIAADKHAASATDGVVAVHARGSKPAAGAASAMMGATSTAPLAPVPRGDVDDAVAGALAAGNGGSFVVFDADDPDRPSDGDDASGGPVNDDEADDLDDDLDI